MRITSPALLALTTTTLLPLPVWAAPGQGTLADPIVVDALPYALASTTQGAPSDAIDTYSCATGTNESGPERVFRFSLPAKARVTAWVEGDGGGVDIDVHLLKDATLAGKQASACVARGNKIAEADLEAGDHWVVVDSFNGASQAGDFVLRLYAIGDSWVETPLANGVTWRARRFSDLSGGQVIHELIIVPGTQGVSVRSVAAQGCQTISSLGGSLQGAIAGVNGGFFVMNSTCPPVSMLKEDGVLLKANDRDRGSFGITTSGTPLIEMVEEGKDWPAAYGAHGGGPLLVVKGTANKGQATWSAQGFNDVDWNGINPRTVAGIDPQGSIHFFTVDGRESPVAVGLSLDDLAAFGASSELGLVDVVNLDGGGSTTFWIRGATPNGVVNYPSGGGLDNPEHEHQRAVSGGFFVYAPEYNHAPRFQTKPVTTASVGTAYVYDADAIDLDVKDTITYSLQTGPTGMTVEATSGVVNYQPTLTSPASAEVTVLAADQKGASTPQTYTLVVSGTAGAGGSGGSGGAGGADSGSGGTGASKDSGGLSDSAVVKDALGQDSALAVDSKTDSPVANQDGGGAVPVSEDAEGCNCRAAGRSPLTSSGLALIGLLSFALRRRRRASQV